jgi:hypothetical protein
MFFGRSGSAGLWWVGAVASFPRYRPGRRPASVTPRGRRGARPDTRGRSAGSFTLSLTDGTVSCCVHCFFSLSHRTSTPSGVTVVSTTRGALLIRAGPPRLEPPRGREGMGDEPPFSFPVRAPGRLRGLGFSSGRRVCEAIDATRPEREEALAWWRAPSGRQMGLMAPGSLERGGWENCEGSQSIFPRPGVSKVIVPPASTSHDAWGRVICTWVPMRHCVVSVCSGWGDLVEGAGLWLSTTSPHTLQ